MSATRRFHWKVFVSFYVVFSFLALAASGIVLYIAPPGSGPGAEFPSAAQHKPDRTGRPAVGER
jgi:hypothetical protein